MSLPRDKNGNIYAPPQSSRRHIGLIPDLSMFIQLTWNNNVLDQSGLQNQFKQPQAVASSVHIAHGASYLVTRKKIPEADEQVWKAPRRNSQGGTTHDITFVTRKSWDVVYKIAQVQFDAEGKPYPVHRSKYAGILLDLLVLTHEPILKHDNIVRLLGLAWGSNGFLETNQLPVPILEHAQHGHLGELQETVRLAPEEKGRVLWEIATAIQFLHQCAITHGDIKAENVLMFAGVDLRFKAKLSDFGASVVGHGGGGEGFFSFIPCGTRLWSAPEIHVSDIPQEEVHLTDIFSFGLLAWKVSMDGWDPLSRIFLHGPKDSQEITQADTVRCSSEKLAEHMAQNMIVPRAQVSYWLPTKLQLGGTSWALPVQRGEDETGVAGNKEAWVSFSECLDKVTEATLPRDPQARDLKAVITVLEQFGLPSKGLPTPVSITENVGYHILKVNSYTTSWNAMRKHHHSTQSFVFGAKCKDADAFAAATGKSKCDLDFGIGCCFISGMGSDRYLDPERGLKYLLRGANNGSTGAQAILYRLAKTFGKNIGQPVQMLEWCAMRGSLAALENLHDLDPQKHQVCMDYLRDTLSGVGAEFYTLYMKPWRYVIVVDISAVQKVLENENVSPTGSSVNIRGDRIIHVAANFGKTEIVQWLVEDRVVSVNLQNSEGETALLCAARAGHLTTVEWLLNHGALVSISSTRGETPLHWLISFPDDQARHVLKLFMEKDGKECLDVWAARCNYAATIISGNIDRWDKLCNGPPVQWAICRKRINIVRFLLEAGSSVSSFLTDAARLTAMDLAAYLHEPEILQLMIDTAFTQPRFPYYDLGNRKVSYDADSGATPGSCIPGFSKMIVEAINGCDTFKMALRHGPAWKSKMRETFRILGTELGFVKLENGINDEFGRTPLDFAATTGFHEAMPMIFEFMNGAAGVNIRWSLNGRTPIFEAIRRDNKTAFKMLLDRDARLDIRISSPNRSSWDNWCILHVIAQNVEANDLELALLVLDAGIPPDGYFIPERPAETPLAVALEENQFKLADLLRSRGADINATCSNIMSNRVLLKFPTTILGRVVASNLRYSAPRLRYLLWPEGETSHYASPSFIAVPSTRMTVLHIACLGSDVLATEEERDPEVAANILGLLLDRFEDPEHLNAQTDADAMTALHMAAQRQNWDALKQLLDKDGIDTSLQNREGKTALMLALETMQSHLQAIHQENLDLIPKWKSQGSKLKALAKGLVLLSENVTGDGGNANILALTDQLRERLQI